jgi:hypothetical protein
MFTIMILQTEIHNQCFKCNRLVNWGQMKNKDTQESVMTSSKVSDQYLHHEWQQQLAPISPDLFRC